LGRFELKFVYPACQSARLTIVDVASRVQHDDHIVVEMTWVVDRDVSQGPNAHRSQRSCFSRADLPWPWADKPFPRHARASFNQSCRIKVCYKPNLIGIAASIVCNG